MRLPVITTSQKPYYRTVFHGAETGFWEYLGPNALPEYLTAHPQTLLERSLYVLALFEELT